MILALTLLALRPPAPDETARFARWEKEIVAIEKRLKENPPPAGGVVFAGSSSIRLWNLKASFPDRGYTNVGFGGAEIRDVTHFVGRIVTPARPSVVVFYAGDNDIASGRTPDNVLADFRAFCAAVHADLPKCRVLFLSVKTSVARLKKVADQTRANARVKEFCATDPRVEFVDVASALLGSDGKPVPELFAKDGLHLSPAGYEKWTAVVNAALAKK